MLLDFSSPQYIFSEHAVLPFTLWDTSLHYTGIHTYFDNYNYNNGEAITIPYCTMNYLLPRPMVTNLKRNLNPQFLTSISKKGVQVCSISSTTSTTISSNHARIPDPSFVNTLNAPFDFDASCAVVYNEYITSTEEDLVANDIKNKMKR